MGFFDKLKSGLSKTKDSFNNQINNVFSTFRKVDEELLEELEEINKEIEKRFNLNIEVVSQEDEAKYTAIGCYNNINYNGNICIGKTTSIGKIANKLRKEGKKVVIAAADTFRAAAVEQLEIWANRAGCEIVKREEGIDPASVVFDAIKVTKETNADVLICDTAGRLHNKKYLMDELAKIQKVIDRELSECSKEVLLVLDATTGQNAISQVKAFKETTPITGLVLTKLDGTAKGGVVVGIVNENKIPVKFIGVGEQIDDMEIFDSNEFINAII